MTAEGKERRPRPWIDEAAVLRIVAATRLELRTGKLRRLHGSLAKIEISYALVGAFARLVPSAEAERFGQAAARLRSFLRVVFGGDVSKALVEAEESTTLPALRSLKGTAWAALAGQIVEEEEPTRVTGIERVERALEQTLWLYRFSRRISRRLASQRASTRDRHRANEARRWAIPELAGLFERTFARRCGIGPTGPGSRFIAAFFLELGEETQPSTIRDALRRRRRRDQPPSPR